MDHQGRRSRGQGGGSGGGAGRPGRPGCVGRPHEDSTHPGRRWSSAPCRQGGSPRCCAAWSHHRPSGPASSRCCGASGASGAAVERSTAAALRPHACGAKGVQGRWLRGAALARWSIGARACDAAMHALCRPCGDQPPTNTASAAASSCANPRCCAAARARAPRARPPHGALHASVKRCRLPHQLATLTMSFFSAMAANGG